MKQRKIEKLPEVKPFLRVKKEATLLRPERAPHALPFSVSKVGGIPNLNLVAEWPRCPACGSPLNFVLQLYRKEFPEFYFPGDDNIFLLFRCPDFFCKGSKEGESDMTMVFTYGVAGTDTNKSFERPELTVEEPEGELPECSFNPEKTLDYPSYEEGNKEHYEKLGEKYFDDTDFFEEFLEKYQPKAGLKLNGFPTWVHAPHYPVCTCGEKKEQFLQITSEDSLDPPFEWPPHYELTGDLCNLYFFVCRKCGPDSIETRCEFHL